MYRIQRLVYVSGLFHERKYARMNSRDELKWQEQGNCVNTNDPEMWFPDQETMNRKMLRTGWRKTYTGKIVAEACGTCPVTNDCLRYALQFTDLRGIWGGLSEYERQQLQKAGNLPTRSILGDSAEYVREYLVDRNSHA